MAVITQFVVVREGVEKMTFTSKKEADAYDRMLDIADNLLPFIQASEATIDDTAAEKLAFYMAANKDTLASLLKGAPVKTDPVAKTPKKKVDDV
ncbi:YebG family protein [Shewanella yunxiaonensis]|uniref:YebG family protein n=1 Tax=Shewanella yunxiaonensis TaxID=2829809 RepID=A0ABX7YPJ4_9GAMM|nr:MULTISPECIES: YebG family protein [Shewanella]MDF0535284.1 YebG family protein [Shewanella sp. A32]QUN04552.1 YebG family protein [Shewanella yunxiaonensis]